MAPGIASATPAIASKARDSATAVAHGTMTAMDDQDHPQQSPDWHAGRSPVRMTAGLAAIPAGALAGCTVGPGVWWFKALYFDAARATAFAATLAVLVSGSLLLVAAVPSGRWQARVLAAVPALWGAAAGVWIGYLVWGPFTGTLLVMLSILVAGGGAELWVWWWQHGRACTGRVAAATAVLLLLIPFCGGWWLWHMSAHLGTAGEDDPAKAVKVFFGDLGAVDRHLASDVGRLVCHDDASGRAQTRAFLDSWAEFYRTMAPGVSVSVLWIGDRPTVDGDRATVRGGLTTNFGYSNGTWSESTSRLTLRLHHEDGWRVCGFPGLHIDPSGSSVTPSPAPSPPTASPSPSDDGGLVNGAPSAMQRCGPSDPYRRIAPSLGWYTCPPK